MRACARRYGGPMPTKMNGDLLGCLHDFDYEMFPALISIRLQVQISSAVVAIPNA